MSNATTRSLASVLHRSAAPADPRFEAALQGRRSVTLHIQHVKSVLIEELYALGIVGDLQYDAPMSYTEYSQLFDNNLGTDTSEWEPSCIIGRIMTMISNVLEHRFSIYAALIGQEYMRYIDTLPNGLTGTEWLSQVYTRFAPHAAPGASRDMLQRRWSKCEGYNCAWLEQVHCQNILRTWCWVVTNWSECQPNIQQAVEQLQNRLTKLWFIR